MASGRFGNLKCSDTDIHGGHLPTIVGTSIVERYLFIVSIFQLARVNTADFESPGIFMSARRQSVMALRTTLTATIEYLGVWKYHRH